MATLPNRLQWSYSRMSTFQECRRRYYYQYYGKWGGWEPQAPAEVRDIYRLSQMKSLDTLCGEIVHQKIAKVLSRFRYVRRLIALQECLAEAREDWERALAESQGKRWLLSPKRYTCLIEDYYGHEGRQQKTQQAWQRIVTCLVSFYDSPTWDSLQRAKRERWLALDGDPFKTVSIYGIDVFGRPDLGYDASPTTDPKSRVWVFDWKTGKERKSHQQQLRFYALYAEGAWGFLPDTVNARLIYLYPELSEVSVKVTADILKEARQVLLASYQEMGTVVTDSQANEPLALEHFPPSRQPHICRYCQFQEICTD